MEGKEKGGAVWGNRAWRERGKEELSGGREVHRGAVYTDLEEE